MTMIVRQLYLLAYVVVLFRISKVIGTLVATHDVITSLYCGLHDYLSAVAYNYSYNRLKHLLHSFSLMWGWDELKT